MNFENTWYLIIRQGRHGVMSHANFSKLKEDEYIMLENFPTQHAALAEYQRLVKLDIADAKLKLDKKQ